MKASQSDGSEYYGEKRGGEGEGGRGANFLAGLGYGEAQVCDSQCQGKEKARHHLLLFFLRFPIMLLSSEYVKRLMNSFTQPDDVIMISFNPGDLIISGNTVTDIHACVLLP